MSVLEVLGGGGGEGGDTGTLTVFVSVLLSFCLSCLSGYFLGIVSLVFPKFWQVARKLNEVVCDRGRFYGKYLLPKNWERRPKMGQNRVFYEFIEISGPLIFTEFVL